MNELQILTFLSSSERTLIIKLLEKHLNALIEALSRDGFSEAATSIREQIKAVFALLAKVRRASAVSESSVAAAQERQSST